MLAVANLWTHLIHKPMTSRPWIQLEVAATCADLQSSLFCYSGPKSRWHGSSQTQKNTYTGQTGACRYCSLSTTASAIRQRTPSGKNSGLKSIYHRVDSDNTDSTLATTVACQLHPASLRWKQKEFSYRWTWRVKTSSAAALYQWTHGPRLCILTQHS